MEIVLKQHPLAPARRERALPITEYYGSLRRMVHESQDRLIGAPTGFEFLDQMMGGLAPGLHIVSGAPGAGKTTLALHIAASVARAGLPVLYLAFDSLPQHLVLRLVCQQANLDLRRVMEGEEDPEVLEKAMATCETELQRIAILDADPTITQDEVWEMARDLKAEHGAGQCVLMVDFLQLWAAGPREFSEFRHEIGKLVTRLRRFAIEFESPILAISSQNRDRQGESSLASLEGTSDLEYSADTVFFLTRVNLSAGGSKYDTDDPGLAQARTLTLNLRKNRFGDTGSVVIKFLPHIGRLFEETMRDAR